MEWVESEIVRLPDATHLRGVWEQLGYTSLEAGVYDLEGPHYKLAEAINQIRYTPFMHWEVVIGPSDQQGQNIPFLWFDRSDNQMWHVAGWLHREGDEIVAHDVTVAICTALSGENGHRTWTGYQGRALDNLLGEQLTRVLGLRTLRFMRLDKVHGFERIPYTLREQLRHIEKPHSVPTSWTYDHYRVTLARDDESSGEIQFEASTPRQVRKSAGAALLQFALTCFAEDHVPVKIPLSSTM